MKSLYSILGVNPTATAEEITRAYRKRVKETHPDAGGNPEEFREVQTAFDILSSDEKRRAYDESGDAESASEGLTRIEMMLKASVSMMIARVGFAKPSTDLVAFLKAELTEACAMKRRAAEGAEKEIERLGRLRGLHMRTEGETNIFEQAISEEIKRQEIAKEIALSEVADGFEMLAYLSGYKFVGMKAIAGTAQGTSFRETPYYRGMRGVILCDEPGFGE